VAVRRPSAGCPPRGTPEAVAVAQGSSSAGPRGSRLCGRSSLRGLDLSPPEPANRVPPETGVVPANRGSVASVIEDISELAVTLHPVVWYAGRRGCWWGSDGHGQLVDRGWLWRATRDLHDWLTVTAHDDRQAGGSQRGCDAAIELALALMVPEGCHKSVTRRAGRIR
jgi:hypothetical protein